MKFNKSFECLYTIAMTMADNCIGAKELEQRFSKLEEEYQELIEAFDKQQSDPLKFDADATIELNDNLKKELSDVLFVVLHIGHKINASGFELLHMATSKMLARMNDVNYIAKI